MSYATQADLVERFGVTELIQLTDRVNRPASTMDDVVIASALADANGLVDLHVGKVYQLPLMSAPVVLVKAAADIARYYLHGKSADKDGPVLRAYEQALTLLESIAANDVTLDAGGAAPGTAVGGAVQASRPDRAFTRQSLRGL